MEPAHVSRAQDAQAAIEAGADALGFIFWAPSARFIEPVRAGELVRAVPPFVATVGVFVDPEADFVRRAIVESGIGLLQFHGDEDPDFCNGFGLPYIKAFKPAKEGDLLKSAMRYGAAAGWLFDAWDERQVGGTGETFDWGLIPQGLARPLVLSGGLTVQNIGAAVRRIRPYAVDVSSGVESAKGIKDAAKIAAFVQGVRNADQ